MESSKTNFNVGVYFKTTARADQTLDADAMLGEHWKPRFCWSALPRMLMKTMADFRSPATSTSLTEIRPLR